MPRVHQTYEEQVIRYSKRISCTVIIRLRGSVGTEFRMNVENQIQFSQLHFLKCRLLEYLDMS